MRDRDVHPTLEAVARAICHAEFPDSDDWPDFLPEARAALNTLIGSMQKRGYEGIVSDWLREIAAEPKPTPEQVLTEHHAVPSAAPGGYRCSCGEPTGPRMQIHQADELRKAGLLREDS